MQQQWKLATNTDGSRTELYDLHADLAEENDLAKAKPGVADLEKKLVAWKAAPPEKPSGEVFPSLRETGKP